MVSERGKWSNSQLVPSRTRESSESTQHPAGERGAERTWARWVHREDAARPRRRARAGGGRRYHRASVLTVCARPRAWSVTAMLLGYAAGRDIQSRGRINGVKLSSQGAVACGVGTMRLM